MTQWQGKRKRNCNGNYKLVYINMYLYIYTFYSKTIKKANGKIVQTDSILKTRPKIAEYEGNPKNYCIKTNHKKENSTST